MKCPQEMSVSSVLSFNPLPVKLVFLAFSSILNMLRAVNVTAPTRSKYRLTEHSTAKTTENMRQKIVHTPT